MKSGKEKIIRMIDIAEKAGVSKAAVSCVLGGHKSSMRISRATAEKILRIAKELNFRPNISAQMLAGKKSGIIGVIIDTFAGNVSFRILSELESLLSEKGYRMMAAQSHNDFSRVCACLDDLISYRAEAVICFCHYYSELNKSVCDEYGDYDKFIFAGKPTSKSNAYVEFDNFSATRDVVAMLYKKGRKRIAFSRASTRNRGIEQRFEGYKEGLKSCGLKFDRRLLIEDKISLANIIYESSYDSLEDKFEAGISHLLETDADALIVSNDNIAAQAIAGLRNKGVSVPGDISVTGFDNDPIGLYMNPKLTTVSQNTSEFAEGLTEMTLSVCNGKAIKTPIIVKPKIIERESA